MKFSENNTSLKKNCSKNTGTRDQGPGNGVRKKGSKELGPAFSLEPPGEGKELRGDLVKISKYRENPPSGSRSSRSSRIPLTGFFLILFH